jgi:hypothetical protein
MNITWKRTLRTASSERFLAQREGRDAAAVDLHYLPDGTVAGTVILLKEAGSLRRAMLMAPRAWRTRGAGGESGWRTRNFRRLSRAAVDFDARRGSIFAKAASAGSGVGAGVGVACPGKSGMPADGFHGVERKRQEFKIDLCRGRSLAGLEGDLKPIGHVQIKSQGRRAFFSWQN